MKLVSLTPMLTVSDAPAAAAFYASAFGAVELDRQVAPGGQAVIELAIGNCRFFAVDENPPAQNLAPQTLGGTSVRLNLIVDDPDAAAAEAIAAGATEVFAVADQPYGLRQGRVADPWGHH